MLQDLIDDKSYIQDLLGHKSGRITTHYSAAEISKLIEAANKIYAFKSNGANSPTLTLLKCAGTSSAQTNAERYYRGNVAVG